MTPVLNRMSLGELELVHRVLERGAPMTRRAVALTIAPCILCVLVGVRGLFTRPNVTDYGCAVFGLVMTAIVLWRHKRACRELEQARAVVERHVRADRPLH